MRGEGGSEENKGAFAILLAIVKAAAEKTQPYFEFNAQGKYPEMSPQEHDEKARLAALNSINTILTDEFNVLCSMDPKEPGSLEAATRNMHPNTVEILDHELAQQRVAVAKELRAFATEYVDAFNDLQRETNRQKSSLRPTTKNLSHP